MALLSKGSGHAGPHSCPLQLILPLFYPLGLILCSLGSYDFGLIFEPLVIDE